jgi:hypothetical protein
MTEPALTRFLLSYEITSGHIEPIDAEACTARELVFRSGGTTVGGGVYRIHDIDSSTAASDWVGEAFNSHAGRVFCFGFDWLGRQFATTIKQAEEPSASVLMFEPGTGEILEIPSPFSAFHDSELVDSADAALAAVWFGQWRATVDRNLAFGECVGYKRPLFLGGGDTSDNLEIVDIDVYWGLMSQLLATTSALSAGTQIDSFTISPQTSQRGLFGRRRKS